MKILDVAAMQRSDAEASGRVGATELMRRAGSAAAALVRQIHATGEFLQVVAFAGSGNNGGDAFAACAEIQVFLPCTVYAAPTAKMSEARLDAVNRARDAGVKIVPLPATLAGAHTAIPPQSIILDGLLGIGGRADTAAFAMIIDAMNNAKMPILALDIPSGIDGTTGAPAQPAAIRAAYTLCFGYVKVGVLQNAACDYTGEIYLADIGMPAINASLSATATAASTATASGASSAGLSFEMLSPAEAHALLPVRPSGADKRTAGAPLIIAGSAPYPGAAVLCARGAARMGAGYVTVVTAAATDVRVHCIEQVVVEHDLAKNPQLPAAVTTALEKCTAIGIGPGLGADAATAAGIRKIIEAAKVPLVIDAGALRGLRDHLGLLRNLLCVLTPHAGEFAYLCGIERLADDRRIETLVAFVERTGITTLLKGRPTLIAAYDAQARTVRVHVNPTGTEHLATAGTGDVLTGIIATALAQGLQPVDAARLGAYVHGLAGRAAGRIRERGVIAGDVAEALADVWPKLRAASANSAATYYRVDDVV